MTLLLLGLAAILVEFAWVVPRVQWYPYDYGRYVEMGRLVRQGQQPLGPGRYYPLPTILWVFLPLSFLPDWFRFVWILVPFASILFLFGRGGIFLFLFTPLWYATADAMLDGWLLVPLKWLLENRPIFAGVSAVILLFKPQVAVLPVVYMVVRWLATRDWKNLAAFAVSAGVVCLPAFFLDPQWPLRFLAVLPLRAGETTSILPLLTSSVWSWWYLSSLGKLVTLALLAAAGVTAYVAARRSTELVSVFQPLNLFLLPVLFAANSITLLPLLRTGTEIFIVVLVSIGAFVMDRAMGGFGGGYALIPLACLSFLARSRRAQVSDELAGAAANSK